MKTLRIMFIIIIGFSAACMSPQQTQYDSITEDLYIPTAPHGTDKSRIALISFRDLSGRPYLIRPATSQLTSLMFQSGYYDVIEPSMVENIIPSQRDVSPEKLQELYERYNADLFLTGSLTNFEIRETSSGFCLFFGLLGSYSEKQYIVEAAIDYRLVEVPSGRLLDAGTVENRRIDSSRAAGVLFSQTGAETRVLESSGGRLLRYALRDLLEQLIESTPVEGR